MDSSQTPSFQESDVADAAADDLLSEAAPGKRALQAAPEPPDSGPRSAASLALDRYALGEPVARPSGGRAELQVLLASIAAAGQARDEHQERSATAALARALWQRGFELDQAIKLARRSLLLGDDPELREELSSWFSNLGEAALAAATLRPLLASATPEQASALLLRMSVLLCRAGEARAARDVLEQAMRQAPQDPQPTELCAGIVGFAPEAVSPEEAAQFYLEAADRRTRLGERAAAFENMLRAFEAAPASALACDALARVLTERGRTSAADEVRREHARHVGAQSRAVHLRRLRDALAARDLPRALGACLDARLDAEIELKNAIGALSSRDAANSADPLFGFDDLLYRLGLFDLLAARIELGSERLSGAEGARARVALGRIYFGPLARPDRAVEVFVDALLCDPGNEDALRALLEHARATYDYSPLVEALVRIVESGTSLPVRRACLSRLEKLAETQLNDDGLRLWVEMQRSLLAPEDQAIAERLERLRAVEEHLAAALAGARAELASQTATDRIPTLRRMASLLFSRPDRADALLPVLLELVELAPEERGFQLAVERVLTRQGRFEELEAFYLRALGHTTLGAERARLSWALSSVRRRRGDIEGALGILAPILDEDGAFPACISMIVALSAQSGEELLRARALLRLGASLPPPLRSVLCAVAAEILLRKSELTAARSAAEQAVVADSSSARALVTRGAVGAVLRDQAGIEAMERALAVAVPRAELCEALASAYDAIEQQEVSFAYCLRRIALRPSDPVAAADRLTRATHSDHAARLADTLAWLLGSPQPLESLTPLLAAALRRLSTLEPPRAATLAKRALDVMGPRSSELRLAVLAVADLTGERALAITTLERWLASGAPSADRAELLLDVSRRRRALTDADGAARALYRAIREGAFPISVLAELDVALPAKSPDGELALLVSRAEALSALSEADARSTARAWRELGAAYHELGQDRPAAIAAWERAFALDPDRGIENFAADLLAFDGPELAVAELTRLSAHRSERTQACRLLSVAAAIALEAGNHSSALSLAERALSLDPSRTDVLAVAERAAGPADLDILEKLYDELGLAALGQFGARAVHYRAARQLEKRGELARSFRHAVRAFEAVPSEGAAYLAMVRLADAVGETTEAVRALQAASEACNNPELGSAFLERAALLTGPGVEGQRQRVDVLLRSLVVRPELHTVSALGEAVQALIRLAPEERDVLELRVRRALGSLLGHVQDGEGARIAISFAVWVLRVFNAAGSAVQALARAVECQPTLTDYAELTPHAAVLAPEAGPWLASALERAKTVSFSSELQRLLLEIADARGDRAQIAELAVSLAEANPDDVELVARAERAARAAGEPSLIARALDVVPPAERQRYLELSADEAQRRGDLPRAIELIEKARSLPNITHEASRGMFEHLIELHEQLADADALERLLQAEIERETGDLARRARLRHKLALVLSEVGERERSLVEIESAAGDLPSEPALIEDYVRLSRDAFDAMRLISALGLGVRLQPQSTHQLRWLRELASLLEQQGDFGLACEQWAKVLELDPKDDAAASAMERDAARRGDYEEVVKWLARRAENTASHADLRSIRLRRAMVLEQRLGRPDEARAELELLTSVIGDNLSVLRVLADLNERLGAPLKAAPVWLRGSAVTKNRDEAEDLACRACEAYLASGEVEAAERVLEGMRAWANSRRMLSLAVEVERRRNHPLALADALDDLASLDESPTEQRSRWLVEAAQISFMAGQDQLARARAERAAQLSPGFAEAVLLACSLEYQHREPTSPDQALRIIERLEPLSVASDEQAELRAFLLAAALESAGRPVAAGLALEQAERSLGKRPLLAWALAERLTRGGETERALAYYDAALGGDLRGLGQRSRVALRAAHAARDIGASERAVGYLELAAEDPDQRDTARAEIQALLSENRGFGAKLSGLDLPATEAPVVSLGRYSQKPPADVAEERIVVPPIRSAPPRSGEPAAIKGVALGRIFDAQEPTPTTDPPEEVISSDFSSTRVAKFEPDHAELYKDLSSGSFEAGRKLIAELEQRSDRSHDLVMVCRKLVFLNPTELWALRSLREAALADKNLAYARAIEHVLGVLEPDDPWVEPPALEDQPREPDAVQALLTRVGHGSPALEALALVWEGAERVFRHDPSAYGVTGRERIPHGAPAPLGRMYGCIASALGMLRAPLFQRRSDGGPVNVSLALVSPPAVLVTGEVRKETPELRFHLGAMLLACLPQFVLLVGSPEPEARAILRGLSFAFGPPQLGSISASVPNLAEVLWQSIPPRMQRRLRELGSDALAFEYDAVIQSARVAIRRAGLFACGDLGVALREAGFEDGIDGGPGESLRTIAESWPRNPSIRSLLLLATSAEYAQVRFQPGRGPR
ncbi:MAG TPA: tetratricopeptide repeat protein [Polyangiaceae bacterium]|nr:tetratricopeptide repeat protein [Polyangiaceae bacterium]